MTTDKPSKIILSFTLTAFIGRFVQELYSLVDGAVLGNVEGGLVFAAVGAADKVLTMGISLCSGFCGAVGALLAMYCGAKDNVGYKRQAFNAMLATLSLGAVLAASVSIGAPWLLTVMNTPADLFDAACTYVRICGANLFFTMLFDFAMCQSQSVGDSKLPSIFFTASAILNGLLDVLFVAVLRFGVAGAAVATMLSDAVLGSTFLIVVWRKHPDSRPEVKFNLRRFRKTLSHSTPMGLQSAITAVGAVILQVAINTLGTDYVTATSAGMKIYHVFSCVLVALGHTASVYCAQNKGARKLSRVEEGIRFSSRLVCWYSVFSIAALHLLTGWMTRMFISDVSEQVITLTYRYVMITVLSFPLLGFVNLLRNAIQGLGYTKLASIAGVCELVGRAGTAILLVPLIEYTAVCAAFPICWAITCAFLIPAYFICLRKLKVGDYVA